MTAPDTTQRPSKEPPWPRGAGLVVGLVVALFVMLHFLSAFVLRADPDEYQMLAAAFAVLQGESLFVDVWDNHGPAITWLLAGLLWLFGTEGASAFIPMRGFFAILSLATLGLVYVLARTEIFRSHVTAMLAVGVCVTTVPVAAKAYELRGDNPMNLLWVIALLLWLRAARKNSNMLFFLSGLALGMCFFFSVKTLILGVAAGILFLGWWVMDRRVRLVPMLVFGLGCAIPFALMLAILALQGQFDAFMADYFGKNLSRDRPGLGDGFGRMRKSGKVWMVSTFLALAYGARVYWVPTAPRALRLLWPVAAFLLFQYLFLLPTHWLQSLLPVMPLTAIFLAWMLQDFVRDGRTFGPRARVVVLFVVLAMLWTDVFRIPRRVKDDGFLPPEVRQHQALLDATPRDSLVFSGYGLPFLRTQPLRYKSLVATIRDRARSGDLDLDVPGTLARRDVPYVVMDERVMELPPASLDFIPANYLPLELEPLMAAGKVITPAEGMSVEILIAGDYHWNVESLTINGEPADNPARLEKGIYRMTWAGDEALTLCIAPPAQWWERPEEEVAIDVEEDAP